MNVIKWYMLLVLMLTLDLRAQTNQRPAVPEFAEISTASNQWMLRMGNLSVPLRATVESRNSLLAGNWQAIDSFVISNGIGARVFGMTNGPYFRLKVAGHETWPTVAGIAYHVAPHGRDNGSISAVDPFLTISRAADAAMPGDGVFVHAGAYRERVAPPRDGTEATPILYQGEPGARVFVKGCDPWAPSWQADGVHTSVYHAVPDETLFTDDHYYTDANPLRVEMASTPYGRDGKPEFELGVFRGARPQTPGPRYRPGWLLSAPKSEMRTCARSWFFDAPLGRIYVHFQDHDAPTNHLVEITTRLRVFAPHQRGLGYIHVAGFIFKACGNQFPRNFWGDDVRNSGSPEELIERNTAQAGMLGTRSGHHWVIRDNIFRYAQTIAADIGGERNVFRHDGRHRSRVRSTELDAACLHNQRDDHRAAGRHSDGLYRCCVARSDKRCARPLPAGPCGHKPFSSLARSHRSRAR